MLQLLGVSAAITPAGASPLDSTGSFAAGHTVPRLPWAWCTTFDATTRLCIGEPTFAYRPYRSSKNSTITVVVVVVTFLLFVAKEAGLKALKPNNDVCCSGHTRKTCPHAAK